MDFSLKVYPFICHNVTVLESPKPFSHISSWHQCGSQRERGNKFSLTFVSHWSTLKVRDIFWIMLQKFKGIKSDTFWTANIKKGLLFLMSRAFCYNARKLPPRTNYIALVFSSLVKLGLVTVLKWFLGNKGQAGKSDHFGVVRFWCL